jgi:hypothetical protein
MTILEKMKEKQAQIKARTPPPKFRLPHGSTFSATYDATREKWTVVLTVSATESYMQVAGGLHFALKGCGWQWKKHHDKLAKAQAQAKASQPGPGPSN